MVVPELPSDIAELKEFYDAQGCLAPQSVNKLSTMVDNSVCFVVARDSNSHLVGIARERFGL